MSELQDMTYGSWVKGEQLTIEGVLMAALKDLPKNIREMKVLDVAPKDGRFLTLEAVYNPASPDPLHDASFTAWKVVYKESIQDV